MLEIIFDTNGVKTTLHDTNSFSVLSEESSSASKLETKVHKGDETYDNLFPGITDVTAYDTGTNEVVFEGYVLSAKPTQESSGTVYKTIVCAHLLSRLTKENVVGFEDASGNVYTMVSRILDIYNTTALNKHKIYMGACPTTGGHPDVLHIFSATCFDAITQIVVTDAGWEFRSRYSNGKWYLDIADDLGEFTSTDIVVGVNMIDISKTIDASELYTRVIPIGGASWIPDEYRNPTMSTVHDTPGMPLTIYGAVDARRKPRSTDIYVANTKLEAKYPILSKVVQFEDITATDYTDFYTARSNLLAKGIEAADALTDIVESYETTAVDLARAGYDYETIELNKMYHIMNPSLEIDTWLKVTSKKTDYSNPAKCELTFGPLGKSAARYLSHKNKATDQKLNDLGTAAFSSSYDRMDGMHMKDVSKTEYDSTTHDSTTLYTVTDAISGTVELYKGDTKVSGSGGGWSVDNAVILVEDNFDDWDLEREFMTSITPKVHLYYGGEPDFIILQGMPCYFGALAHLPSGSGGTQPQTLRNSTALFQKLLDNKELFSASSSGDLNTPDHSLTTFSSAASVGTRSNIIYTNWSLLTYQVSWYSSSIRQLCYIYQSQWYYPSNRIPVTASVVDYFYDNLYPSDTSNVARYNNQYHTRTNSGGYAYGLDGGSASTYLTSLASDAFVLPLVTAIFPPVIGSGSPVVNAPYGYASLYLVPIVNDRWCYTSASSLPQIAAVPFASQAEYNFALGLTRRTEPVSS